MKKTSCKCSFTKAVMLNSFQHLHLNQPLLKEEEILNQVQDDNKRQGFTLIELLVVVLIIGILAAVAVPQYQKAVLKSRFSTVFHLVKAIHEAEEIYYLENGKYTNQIEDLAVELPEAQRNSSPGGNTWLDWNNGQYRVAIQSTLVSGAVRDKEGNYYLQYQQYYFHSGWKGQIRCLAFDDAAKAICQGLGGSLYDSGCVAGDTGQNCTIYTL